MSNRESDIIKKFRNNETAIQCKLVSYLIANNTDVSLVDPRLHAIVDNIRHEWNVTMPMVKMIYIEYGTAIEDLESNPQPKFIFEWVMRDIEYPILKEYDIELVESLVSIFM